MPLRKMKACLAAAGRRFCRRQGEFLTLMSLAAQGDEKSIRKTLGTLRKGANLKKTSGDDEGERLIIITDAD